MQIPLTERQKVRTMYSGHLRVEILVWVFRIQAHVVPTTPSIDPVVHVEVFAGTVPEAKIVAVVVLERIDDERVSVSQLGLHEVHAILDRWGRGIWACDQLRRCSFIDVRDVGIDNNSVGCCCAHDVEEVGQEEEYEHHVG